MTYKPRHHLCSGGGFVADVFLKAHMEDVEIEVCGLGQVFACHIHHCGHGSLDRGEVRKHRHKSLVAVAVAVGDDDERSKII